MNQRFQVSGMNCGHCVRAVTDAVRGVDAGAAVVADLASGNVLVTSGADRAALEAAIVAEGYGVAAA